MRSVDSGSATTIPSVSTCVPASGRESNDFSCRRSDKFTDADPTWPGVGVSGVSGVGISGIRTVTSPMAAVPMGTARAEAFITGVVIVDSLLHALCVQGQRRLLEDGLMGFRSPSTAGFGQLFRSPTQPDS